MRNIHELTTRWILPILLATLGLAAINLLWLVPAIKNIRSSASVLTLEIADRMRVNLQFELENAIHELTSAGEEITLEPERTKLILDHLLKMHPQFSNVAVAGRDGKETMRIDQYQIINPEDFQDHSRDPYFYLALEKAANFLSVFMSEKGEPHTTLAVPMEKWGDTRHVLIADLNLQGFVKTTTLSRIAHVTSFVLDHEGNVIIHPSIDEFTKHKNLAHLPLVQKILIDGQIVDGLKTEDGYKNNKGVEMFAVGMPIGLTSWGIVVERPRNEAFAGERVVISFAVITLLLGVLIVVVVVTSNVRLDKLNRRLNELLHENYETGKILVRRDIELTEANMRLIALDQIKSEFVSVAAHQLRTPLTGIRWTFNALLDRELGDFTIEQQKVLEDGLKSSIRMIELINDLLNIARIEEGKFGFQFKRQSFAKLMDNVVEQIRRSADEKGITLLLDMSSNLPLVEIDGEKIALALENVLDNAVKYTFPGGKIMVNASLMQEAIKIIIADTGIGISKSQSPRLFTKFFRGDNALRFQTSGTGLGLYVAKNIIESHRGSIFISSIEQQGTTVTILLPIKEQH